MGENDLLKVFRERGALLQGHFGLTSGRHSPIYLQCALVLQYPEVARALGQALARLVLETLALDDKAKLDLVVSPAVGGIVIGQEVASHLNVRAIFSERVDGEMTFRRGFAVGAGERTIAVEDVVTTGGSIRETVNLAASRGGHVLATASIVHRYTEEPEAPTEFPHISLLKVHAPAYDPAHCPLCEDGIPVEKPGSRHLSVSKGL